MPRLPRSPKPEAAGHENPAGAVQQPFAAVHLQRLGLDPVDVHLQPVLEAAVRQGFGEALVRVLVAHVLADHVNGHLAFRLADALEEVAPRAHPAFRVVRKLQVLQHDPVEPLRAEHQRHLVDAVDVLGGDDGALVDVAEQGDLAAYVLRQESVGAAQQQVRLDADGAQVADAVLRRLGLQLAGRADEGDQREVDVQRMLAPDVAAELPYRFQVRLALDVADRAADLRQDDVDVPADRAQPVLDLVRDVRDHLHGAPEVVSRALLLDHGEVDLAGGPVVVARRDGVGEAFVVSQVEVGLGAVRGDVHLAVLVRAHGARVHVHVGIELLQRHAVAVALQQAAYRGRREPLAQRGDDAAGDEDVLDAAAVGVAYRFRHHAPSASRQRTRSRSSGVSTPTGAPGTGTVRRR